VTNNLRGVSAGRENSLCLSFVPLLAPQLLFPRGGGKRKTGWFVGR